MRREKCNDCGTESPEIETDYTLISARYGWRVVRTRNAAGEFVIEWRCPTCWAKHKNRPAGGEPAPTPARRSAPPHSARQAALAAGKLFGNAMEKLRKRREKK